MRLEWRQADLAYAAGYLDGEGCFTIGPNWRIVITCTNTHRHTVEWLKEMFGGTISGPSKVRKENWRPTYQWKVSSRQAAEVIKSIKPYLQEKAPQADLLLRMRETVGDGSRLTPELLAQRQSIKIAVKEMKRATH